MFWVVVQVGDGKGYANVLDVNRPRAKEDRYFLSIPSASSLLTIVEASKLNS